MKLGSAMAVFIIFFALALYEAIAARNWLFAAVFVALALLSLRADSLVNKRR